MKKHATITGLASLLLASLPNPLWAQSGGEFFPTPGVYVGSHPDFRAWYANQPKHVRK